MSIENSANAMMLGRSIGKSISADLVAQHNVTAATIEALLREELSQLNLSECEINLAVQCAFDELIEHTLRSDESAV